MSHHRDPNSIHPSVARLMTEAWPLLILIVAFALLALAPSAIRASDHADPMNLQDPEANITGLFFFPHGDQMVLVFNVRRSLRNPKPYNLEPYEYVINMDLKTPVTFENEANNARYGGTIATPGEIHVDAAITVHLNNDATLKSVAYRGLKNTDGIRTFTGVRDDPFIFPRFFKQNVISMVLSIPRSSFPDDRQQDFILWGTTSKAGKQIDHVGRSIRTQLPRFDSLNTLPPSEHVKEVMRLMEKWDGVYNFFNDFQEWWSKAIAGVIETTLKIRAFDAVADVMIYTDRRKPGFPNGRQLPDDVVLGVCQAGDCLLVDLAMAKGVFPRQTVNDKEFLPDFPYLAEPWPDEAEQPASTKSIYPYVIGLLILVAIVGWIAVEIVRRLFLWLWHWWRRRAAPAT
jgi:hypothetical protein